MSTNIRAVYITFPDIATARTCATVLVEERLAACANILPAIESVYWWNNALCRENECALIAKTTSENIEPLIARVKLLHSYKIPCITVFDVTNGNSEFLVWVMQETRNPGKNQPL